MEGVIHVIFVAAQGQFKLGHYYIAQCCKYCPYKGRATHLDKREILVCQWATRLTISALCPRCIVSPFPLCHILIVAAIGDLSGPRHPSFLSMAPWT